MIASLSDKGLSAVLVFVDQYYTKDDPNRPVVREAILKEMGRRVAVQYQKEDGNGVVS